MNPWSHPHRRIFRLVLVLVAVALGARTTARAQYIQVRVSVKFILNANGVRPTGLFANAAHWRQAIDLVNAGNARMGRGFRYAYPTFDGNVSGFGQFYELTDGEEEAFEYAMRTSPQTGWRADALNVYVVNHNLGSPTSPACAGWASNPQDPLKAPYQSLNGRIVVFCVNMGPDVNPLSIVAHEFGHHHGLIHTWADDRVADTPVDADATLCERDSVPDWCSCKFSNTLARAASAGWSPTLLKLMTNNLMSYHCGNDLDYDLSEGQLDRWADMTRMYLASEGTGITRFVKAGSTALAPDGYSTSYFITFPGLPTGGPYPSVATAVGAAAAGGGDIIILRPANYNERFTINKPVTLRATRQGAATIGKGN